MFSCAKQFERALADAEEQAGGAITSARVAPSQDKDEEASPSVEEIAAADAAASQEAREAVARARSVMGSVGREHAPTRVSYSSSQGQGQGGKGSAAPGGGNRAARRAAAKKARRRR